MLKSFKFRLPSKKDWAWVLALIVLGAALGFGVNALADPGVGINLQIALDLNPPPASAQNPAVEP